jgi:hypothetical protein
MSENTSEAESKSTMYYRIRGQTGGQISLPKRSHLIPVVVTLRDILKDMIKEIRDPSLNRNILELSPILRYLLGDYGMLVLLHRQVDRKAQ